MSDSFEIVCPECGKPYASAEGECPNCMTSHEAISHDEEEEYSPFEYAETARRSKHCFLIGLGLLIGVVSPIVMTPGSDLVFPLFGGGGVDGGALAVQWYLLLVGIGIMILSKDRYQGSRGPILLGLAILHIVAGIALSNPFSNFRGGSADTLGLIMMLAAIVGWWCLVAGARTRYFQPDSAAAHTVGLMGGIVILGVLLVPVLPEQAGYVLIALPFQAFGALGGGGTATAVGLILLALMGMMVYSSLVCVTNSPTKDSDAISHSALNAFQLACMIIPSFFVVTVFIGSAVTGSFSNNLVELLVNNLKIFALIAAAVFLMPIAISECMLRARR